MFLSSFRFYSIGIVAEDKEADTHDIYVIPIEAIPDISGDLEAVEETTEVSGKGAGGGDYSVKITSSNVIQATWMPIGGSNRITSPDLKKGEKVIITQVADADRYYWTTLGKDDGLRRLETVVYAIGADPKPDATLDPDENMYTLEMSSDTKQITLRTTKANEEPFAYEIKLDLAVGTFELKDDDENFVLFNSQDCVMTAKNKFDTEVTMDQAVIRGYAEEDITITSMGTFNGHVEGDVNLMCNGNVTSHVEQDINATCNGTLTGYVKTKVDLTCDGPFVARAPEMQFGEDGAVQPSVLGDNLATAMSSLIDQINASQVIGNLGAPTSPIQGVKPVEEPDLIDGGASYSTVNTNQ